MNEPLINGLLSFLITVMNRAWHDIRIVAKRAGSPSVRFVFILALYLAFTRTAAAATLARAITRFAVL